MVNTNISAADATGSPGDDVVLTDARTVRVDREKVDLWIKTDVVAVLSSRAGAELIGLRRRLHSAGLDTGGDPASRWSTVSALDAVERTVAHLRLVATLEPNGHHDRVDVVQLVAAVARTLNDFQLFDVRLQPSAHAPLLVDTSARRLVALLVRFVIDLAPHSPLHCGVALDVSASGDRICVTGRVCRLRGHGDGITSPGRPARSAEIDHLAGTVGAHQEWDAITPHIQRLSLGRAPQGAIQRPLRAFADRHTLIHDGREERLTWTEWQMLRFMHNHARATLTRAELATAVWGSEQHGRESEVEVYISRIRRKLERDPRRPRRLVTIRREGYRLELSDDVIWESRDSDPEDLRDD